MTADAQAPTLAAWLLEQIAADGAVARSAIQAERPGTHWRWFDDETDEPAGLDGEYEGGMSLRTVEQFPARIDGWTLPAFIVQGTEIAQPEQAGAFRHIARWDPARVLVECAAKRQIVEMADEADYDRDQLAQEHCVTRAEEEALCAASPGELIRRALASVYADREGWREEWR